MVQGTLDYGISFTGGSWDLTAYIDEDWARDINKKSSFMAI